MRRLLAAALLLATGVACSVATPPPPTQSPAVVARGAGLFEFRSYSDPSGFETVVPVGATVDRTSGATRVTYSGEAIDGTFVAQFRHVPWAGDVRRTVAAQPRLPGARDPAPGELLWPEDVEWQDARVYLVPGGAHCANKWVTEAVRGSAARAVFIRVIVDAAARCRGDVHDALGVIESTQVLSDGEGSPAPDQAP